MKRSAVAIATIGTVLSLSAPASASPAPPDVEAFDIFTPSQCTSSAPGQRTCTSVSLSAHQDNVSGFGSVSVSVHTSTTVDGDETSTFESGFAGGRNVSVVTDRSLNVQLEPIAVTLVACGLETCDVTRDVVISANNRAVTAVATTRSKTSTRDGNCVTTSTTDTRSAGIAGTIAVDGVTYDDEGGVRTEDTRFTARCK